MASASVPASPSTSLHHDASPGSKRPGEGALEAVRARKRQNPGEMLPPAPRPVTPSVQAVLAPKVVDDDEFETKLAAIIERDYFPDIKRLQNKLEWTQATESGDVDRIANAQRNIVLRRAGFSVPLNAQVTCSSEPSPTPDRSQSLNTSNSNATPATPETAAADKPPPLPEGTILAPPQNVASFTAKHTTEDQASMDAIVAADNARRRIRHQWAYEESDRTNAHLIAAGHKPGLLAVAPPSTTAAIGPSESAAAITEGPSTSATAADAAPGTVPSTPDEPSQSNHHPSALVITLPDDGGTPRRRMRRAHPMPVLRSSHAAPPSRAAIAAAKAMRSKAQVQAQAQPQANTQAALLHSVKSALYYPPARSLPLSLNERRLLSAGAPPQTIAAHTRFPSSSQTVGNGRAGSETPSTLASTPSRVYSESPASTSGGAEDMLMSSRTAEQTQGGGHAQEQQHGAAGDANVTQIGGSCGMGPVATPSPAGLGAAAPIMTWGEVAGTPMVLDEEDLFQGEGAGRVGVSSRGVLQGPRSVKETAAETARKELAQTRVRGHTAWSQGRQGGQSTRQAMSPAAQSYLKKLQGKSPWAQLDAQLRASYGHRTPGTSSRSALAQTAAPALTPLATAGVASASPRGLLGEMTPERHA